MTPTHDPTPRPAFSPEAEIMMDALGRVERPTHDPEARDDEAQLQINTDGWVRCPVPLCGWKMDPSFPDCPDHGPIERRSDA